MDDHGKRILVVGDDEDLRLLIQVVLERDGYDVVSVCDGLDALVEIKRRHVDVIVADLFLPILDGVELVGHIRDTHPEILVILVSGELPCDLCTADDGPFYACLRKPFENAMLLELVRAATRLSERAHAGSTSSVSASRS